jgi:hypothetical protein
MIKTITRIFAEFSASRQPAPLAAVKDSPATIEDGSENSFRRQLVGTVARDLMRRHGMPAHWIDCQMMMVSSRTRGSGMYLRLVVRHWDARLMDYASAFQKELMTDIKQFEPLSANWLYGVSWQLEIDDCCPYTTLPSGSFWQESNPHGEPVQDQAESVKSVELNRLFATRDQRLHAQTGQDRVGIDYERTQPMPLLEPKINTKSR